MRTPAAEHLIRQRVTALGRALPGAKGGDTRSVHQARVATRRLREALPLLGGSKGEKLSRAARKLTRALGPVRELDVALMILEELAQAPDAPREGIQRLRLAV